MDDDVGYIILRQCIDNSLVRKARESLHGKTALVEAQKRQGNEGLLIIHISKKLDEWPPECKLLRTMVEQTVPFSKYNPWPAYKASHALAKYQAKKLWGRGQPDSYFYTICLEESLGLENGLPEYAPGSHKLQDAKEVGKIQRPPMSLHEGDFLVWHGSMAFYAAGTGGGGRIMLIQFTRS